MKFALETGVGRLVEAYDRGRIRIAGSDYRRSVLVVPDQPVTPWPPTSPGILEASDLEPILEYRPQVAIIGTGERLAFPPTSVLRALIDANIGYEFMDTGAACRTYNLLATEGRRVVAALMIPEDL